MPVPHRRMQTSPARPCRAGPRLAEPRGAGQGEAGELPAGAGLEVEADGDGLGVGVGVTDGAGLVLAGPPGEGEPEAGWLVLAWWDRGSARPGAVTSDGDCTGWVPGASISATAATTTAPTAITPPAAAPRTSTRRFRDRLHSMVRQAVRSAGSAAR